METSHTSHLYPPTPPEDILVSSMTKSMFTELIAQTVSAVLDIKEGEKELEALTSLSLTHPPV